MRKFGSGTGFAIVVLLVAGLFAASFAFAQPAAKPAAPAAKAAQPAAAPPAAQPQAQGQGVGPSKDWTEQQLQEFVKKPWTQEELNKMGRPPRYILNKTIHPRATGANLTPKQLYENGENRHRALMFQYGLGMNAKDFYKIWFEQEGFKDPKIKLLDLRQESEFQEARIPGAIRVDTGLAYWQLPGKAPDSTLTYYLLCKGGTPENGGSRGALVAKAMVDMGYSGKIINITDGFRGWIENGFPVMNQHGLFTLVPGSFQVPEKDAPNMMKQVTPVVAPMVMDEAKKLNIKDW